MRNIKNLFGIEFIKTYWSKFSRLKSVIFFSLFLYVLLFILTIFSFFVTLVSNEYGDLCFSNECIGNFYKNFENIIKMHLAAAEYIMWGATTISVTLAVQSYRASTRANISSINQNNWLKFLQIVNSVVGRNSDIKDYHLNIDSLYSYIYDDDDGMQIVSRRYEDSIRELNDLIKSYKAHKASESYGSYSGDVIKIFMNFGFYIKNRGRKNFRNDELAIVKFLNELNLHLKLNRNFQILIRSVD